MADLDIERVLDLLTIGATPTLEELRAALSEAWMGGESAGWNYAIHGGSPTRNPYDQEQGHLKDLRD